MSYGWSNSKRDANEKSLVELWRGIGCEWIEMGEWAGFDGILLSPFTGIHIVEIKNPEYSRKLTDAEAETKKMCESMGVPYNVIALDEEAVALARE